MRRLIAIGACLALLVAATGEPAAAQAQKWCGELSSNTTWAGGAAHQVCETGVRVSGNATLTIQPAADVLMAEGASLIIEAGSKLSAIGSAEQVIRVRADTRDEVPGFWGQILFEPGAADSTIANASVQHGGRGGVPMIEVRHSVVLMSGLNLRSAADVPLAFTADALGPSLEAAGNVTVGQACRIIVVASNNAVPAIGVLADEAIDIAESATWHNFCVPYRVTDQIAIGGEADPELRLDVGVTLNLSGNGGFRVGLDSDNPGMLSANGTPTEPIRLTSATSQPGDWAGIDFSPYSGFSGLSNTRVEYGGRGGQPMVSVRSTEVTSLGSSFHNAAGYPLAIVPEAVGLFLSGVFDEVDPVAGAFTGNGIQRIHVLATESAGLSRSATWGDAGVPLEIDGDLFVGGSVRTEFRLLAGTHLVFAEGARLVVGDRPHGAAEIDARGTADRPVRLSGLKSEPGAWAGVRIGELTASARFVNTVFEYGGAPMVEWARVSGDVARCTFRGASGYPLVVPLSVAHDVVLAPEIGGEDEDLRSTFEGNGTDRVLVQVDRALTATIARWRDPGAPVEMDGAAVVSGPATPILNLQGGLRLVFRPGAGLQIGSATGRGGLTVTDASVDGPKVTLGPVEAGTGWAGVTVRNGSSMESLGGLSITGVAADAVAILVEGGGQANVSGATFEGAARGTGVIADGAESTVALAGVTVTGFRTGLHARAGGTLGVTRSAVTGNAEWGFLNENAPGGCLSAVLVWWGDGKGPRDDSDADDGCTNAANDSPDGDRVSDHIAWWPYAIDTDYTPSSGLGPNPWRAYLPFALAR